MLNKPGKNIIRKMGYISDQKGILKRYFRESEQWQDHLEKCKSFITEDIRKRKPKEVVVLGSGWLLDFPVEEILISTEKIVLVDINHPPQIIAKARKIQNIELMNADITGGIISSVYNLVRNLKSKEQQSELQNLDYEINDPFPKDSYIVSLNILNQLDILLVDYLSRFSNFTESSILEFRKNIQTAHIDFLSSHQGVLITDYEEKLLDEKSAEITERKLVHVDLPMGLIRREWLWQFDMNGNYLEGKEVEFKILAISF